MPDHILVTFGAVQQASQDANDSAQKLNAQLADLKAYLAPLVAAWQGAAATDYGAKQAKWDSAQQGLNEVLLQIGKAVNGAHDTYNQTESANRSSWG